MKKKSDTAEHTEQHWKIAHILCGKCRRWIFNYLWQNRLDFAFVFVHCCRCRLCKQCLYSCWKHIQWFINHHAYQSKWPRSVVRIFCQVFSFRFSRSNTIYSISRYSQHFSCGLYSVSLAAHISICVFVSFSAGTCFVFYQQPSDLCEWVLHLYVAGVTFILNCHLIRWFELCNCFSNFAGFFLCVCVSLFRFIVTENEDHSVWFSSAHNYSAYPNAIIQCTHNKVLHNASDSVCKFASIFSLLSRSLYCTVVCVCAPVFT